MKSTTPHDSLDELMMAALHGDLSPEERAQFESRLQTDPAAAAAYHEAQAMNDLLEKTHRAAQPDPDFEQRMVSGVRRKLAQPSQRETAWESVMILWRGVRAVIGGHSIWTYGGVCSLVLVCVFTALVMAGNQVKSVFTTISGQLAADKDEAKQKQFSDDSKLELDQLKQQAVHGPTGQFGRSFGSPSGNMLVNGTTLGGITANASTAYPSGGNAGTIFANTYTGGTTVNAGTLQVHGSSPAPIGSPGNVLLNNRVASQANGGPMGSTFANAEDAEAKALGKSSMEHLLARNGIASNGPLDSSAMQYAQEIAQKQRQADLPFAAPAAPAGPMAALTINAPPVPMQSAAKAESGEAQSEDAVGGNAPVARASEEKLGAPIPTTAPAATPTPEDTRKLIRNAQLDLEVKSFQAAFDQITVLTKAAGGYVDTSNSQRGGNGKLQGTVVVKILPPNLDAFLLKLHELGEVQNQSVSTDDVTKDYFDAQARLVNSQKMEAQLQDLLKRENGKVSDLLAVERELGRVRGEIEQMQGQLKLYDFQVQYATVTINVVEKDLNQAAAYLLKEQDNFSLFATDVEGTFQKARQAADSFKAQVLAANLQHNSGSDVSASLDVMVAPDQIEPFLGEIRGLGRVANFTRQTERVAKDGGDSTNPADATLTEKDKVRVQVSIRSDDDSREQVAVTVVTKAVDDALDQAKAAALTRTGTEILSSSLNKSPDGASTAQLSVRVPGPQYAALIDAFRALGRASALTVQRNDNLGPNANGDDAPVIVSLSLTDNDAPVQETDLTIAADDVDAQAQQIKKQAADAGAEVKSSSFQHQPDGTELAQMTLRLPLGKYPPFLETLKKAGKVETLSVQRNDRPDQASANESAPADIMLQLHNPSAIIADDEGLWPTLRKTFGEGFSALFGSIRVIGVLIAFLAPWVFTLVLLAWIGRRIYVWRKNK